MFKRQNMFATGTSTLIVFIISWCALGSSIIKAESQRVIRDYAVESVTITVEDAPNAMGDYPGVNLHVNGRAMIDGRDIVIRRQVEGVLLTQSETSGIKNFLFLHREGNHIYGEFKSGTMMKSSKAFEIGTSTENGRLNLRDNLHLDVGYRQYRYSLRERFYALIFGIMVKNSEDLTIDLNVVDSKRETLVPDFN